MNVCPFVRALALPLELLAHVALPALVGPRSAVAGDLRARPAGAWVMTISPEQAGGRS